MYCRSVPLGLGICSVGIGTSMRMLGIDQRHDAEAGVLRQDQRDPRLGGQRRVGDAR